jgi:putative pyruvate formate lyase activating enzyme
VGRTHLWELSFRVDPGALRAALQWARARYESCDVCATDCGVNRYAGELGQCGLGVQGRVYKEYLHLGEERTLLPSHAVYLAGCNLRCVFCSDWDAVIHPDRHGALLSPEALAERIAVRRSEGARNVNFVGGLPDVNVLYILETLAHCPQDTHVVWNTNLWTTPEAIERLTGVVGTWLVDLKFGADDCAKTLAGIDGYTARLHKLLPLADQAGALLVRHLLMPGHLECCTRPSLEWLRTHVPEATVNLMTAYHPFALKGATGPMSGPMLPEEAARGRRLFESLGFTNAMINGQPV